MGRPFKIKTHGNVKTPKKPEEDLLPMKSPYVKDKSEKIYPIFFNFDEQWEPNESTLIISEPSTLWEGSVSMDCPIKSHINKSGKPYGSMIIDSTGSSSYTMRVTESSLIFTRD